MKKYFSFIFLLCFISNTAFATSGVNNTDDFVFPDKIVYTHTIKIGDKDDAINTIEKIIKIDSIHTIGVFDQAMQDGLKNWQKIDSLPITGEIDKATVDDINNVIDGLKSLQNTSTDIESFDNQSFDDWYSGKLKNCPKTITKEMYKSHNSFGPNTLKKIQTPAKVVFYWDTCNVSLQKKFSVKVSVLKMDDHGNKVGDWTYVKNGLKFKSIVKVGEKKVTISFLKKVIKGLYKVEIVSIPDGEVKSFDVFSVNIK